jgi:hypothetical protein
MTYTIIIDKGWTSESEYDTYTTRQEALDNIKRLSNDDIYDINRLDIVIN